MGVRKQFLQKNIKDLTLYTLLQDTRISIHVTPDNIEWELSISSVSTSDTGLYECQVNTNPLSQLMTKLSVTSKNIYKTKKIERFIIKLSCLFHLFISFSSCYKQRLSNKYINDLNINFICYSEVNRDYRRTNYEPCINLLIINKASCF